MKKVSKSEFHKFYGDAPNAIMKVVFDEEWPYAVQIVSKRSGTVIAKKVPTQKEWPHHYEYYINENYRRMKTFEEALKKAIDAAPFTPGLDDGGYNDGFIDGLEYALQLIDKHKDDAINEILTKYHEWAYNISAAQFAKWDDEEGDKEKTKARIRKEFIEFLKREQ